MLRPEGEPTWDPKTKRLITTTIDSQNGIKTTWEQIPDKKVTIRTDISFVPGLKRRVWDIGEDLEPGFFAMFSNTIFDIYSNTTRYDIDDNGQSPFHKILHVTTHKETDEINVSVSLSHLRGGFDFFSVRYNSEGILNGLSFHGNESSGTWPEQMKEFIGDRPYEECFDELVKAAKLKGLTVFTNAIGKRIWKEKDPTIEDILYVANNGLLTSGRLTRTNKISQEEQKEYLNQAAEVAFRELDRLFAQDEFIRNNEEVISVLLAFETLYQFSENSDASESLSNTVKYYFGKAIEYLFGDYHNSIQRAGEFTVSYAVDGMGNMGYSIRSGSDIAARGDVEIGQRFQYEEYSYALGRSGANQLVLTIDNVLKPDPNTQFTFPETVDVAKIHGLVSTSQNTGWEQALDLAPIDLSQKP